MYLQHISKLINMVTLIFAKRHRHGNIIDGSLWFYYKSYFNEKLIKISVLLKWYHMISMHAIWGKLWLDTLIRKLLKSVWRIEDAFVLQKWRQFHGRSVTKFCVNANMTPTETWKFISKADSTGNDSMQLVFKWHNKLKSGDDIILDKNRTGRPKVAHA